MAYLLNYKQFNLDEDTEERDFGGRNEDKVIRSVFPFSFPISASKYNALSKKEEESFFPTSNMH